MKNTLIAAALALTSIAAPAAAGITNLGFEAGLTGWTGFGTTGTAPTYGAFSALPVGSALGYVQSGTGDGVYSTLSQTFTMTLGEMVSGYVGFQAGDYIPFNDDAFLRIVDLTSFTTTTLFTSDVATVGDFGNSGWVAWTFTAPVAGAYVIVLGVTDRGDGALPSGAVLDIPVVPEPATWALMITGFTLVGFASRRRYLGRNA